MPRVPWAACCRWGTKRAWASLQRMIRARPKPGTGRLGRVQEGVGESQGGGGGSAVSAIKRKE